jgi:WD40 repeat protein
MSGSLDGAIYVWDAHTVEMLPPLVGHNGYASSVAFSQDGTRIRVKIRDGPRLGCTQVLECCNL